MKKAIVTGATGLVGKAVVSQLVQAGVEVLCIGRRKLTSLEAKKYFECEVSYLSLEMSNIETLPTETSRLEWDVGEDCVFYHFAWGGDEKLTDGGFDQQFKNATYAANALKIAKNLGCVKFIDSGTMEETYAQRHIENKNITYLPSQMDYTIAKLASRDMCRMVAYLEKIDYVHTRLSVPLKPDLSEGNYIAKTLKEINQGRPYQEPHNKQLFDVILIGDLARAYLLIGKHGRNKADYFVGTADPTTLGDYFKDYERIVGGLTVAENNKQYPESDKKLFDISDLSKDTRFEPLAGRFDLTGAIE
ncbi:MAG: NAD(P)-dependent oxidoreductase [Candidatus Sedimenticola sp. 6PFRAG1]